MVCLRQDSLLVATHLALPCPVSSLGFIIHLHIELKIYLSIYSTYTLPTHYCTYTSHWRLREVGPPPQHTPHTAHRTQYTVITTHPIHPKRRLNVQLAKLANITIYENFKFVCVWLLSYCHCLPPSLQLLQVSYRTI